MAAKKVDDTTLPLLTPRLPRQKDRRGGGEAVAKLMQRIQTGAPERRGFRERRASARVVVALQVEVAAGAETMLMQTHDLSTFGLGVRVGATPPVGAIVRLRLFLPDDPTQPIELSATVLGPWGQSGGARMKFINPPVEAVRRIHRLLG